MSEYRVLDPVDAWEKIVVGDFRVGSNTNSYKGRTYTSSAVGDYISFKFYGSVLRLYFNKDKNAGVVEVTVDSEVFYIDTSASTSQYIQLCFDKTFSKDYHSVSIIHYSKRLVYYSIIEIDIDAILIPQVGTVSSYISDSIERHFVTEDVFSYSLVSKNLTTSSNITYLSVSANTGIEFVTNSPFVRLIGNRVGSLVFDVYVDNVYNGKLNCAKGSSTSQFNTLVAEIILPAGVHCVKLVNANGSTLYIQAFDILKGCNIVGDFNIISRNKFNALTSSLTKLEFSDGVIVESNGCGVNLPTILTDRQFVYLNSNGIQLSKFQLTVSKKDGSDLEQFAMSFIFFGGYFANFFASVEVSYDGVNFSTLCKYVPMAFRCSVRIPVCKKFRLSNITYADGTTDVSANNTLGIRLGNIIKVNSLNRDHVLLSKTFIQKGVSDNIIGTISGVDSAVIIVNDFKIKLSDNFFVITEDVLKLGLNTAIILNHEMTIVSSFSISMFDRDSNQIKIPLSHSEYQLSPNCYFDTEWDYNLKPADQCSTRCWIVIPLTNLQGKFKIQSVYALYAENYIEGSNCFCEYSLDEGFSWNSDINSLIDIYKYGEVLLKVYFFGSLHEIDINFVPCVTYCSNLLEISTPKIGFKQVLQNDNVSYITVIDDGIAFDDAEVDYDLYTAPGNIKLRPLNMGILVGGKTSKIFKFEVINGYDSVYEVILSVCRNGVNAEKDGKCAYLNDFDTRRGQTKVELSLSDENFSPLYPLKVKLGPYERRIVYIRVTPQSVSSSSTEFQVKAVACPV